MARVVCNDAVEFHVIQLLELLITTFSCTTFQFINNTCGIKTTLSKLIVYECFTIVPCFVFHKTYLNKSQELYAYRIPLSIKGYKYLSG